MVAAMKTTSIMKPLQWSEECSLQTEEWKGGSGQLHCELQSPTNKPWLLVAVPYCMNYGLLMWPVQGLPSIITALDSYIMISFVPMGKAHLPGAVF